jgi:hypothetical protein
MNKQNLPQLPCQFGSRWVGSTIFVEDEGICCLTSGDNEVLRVDILFSEIKLVELKLAPEILGIPLGHASLYLHKVLHGYRAAGTGPTVCSLAYFKRKQVSTLLVLLRVYAPQARYNGNAMRIVNEFDNEFDADGNYSQIINS